MAIRLHGTIPLCVHAGACATYPLAAPKSRVGLREFMAMFAVCFPLVFRGGAFSTEYIDFSSDWFKVCGIDAQWCPTQVVDSQVVGDRPNKKFVRKPVWSHVLSIGPKVSVLTISLLRSRPEPTRLGFVDVFPKSANSISPKQFGAAVPVFSPLVHPAQATGKPLAVTPVNSANASLSNSIKGSVSSESLQVHETYVVAVNGAFASRYFTDTLHVPILA